MNPLISISAIIGGAWRNFTKNMTFNVQVLAWGMVLSTALAALPPLLSALSINTHISTYINVAVALVVTVGFSIIWLGLVWAVSEQLDGHRVNIHETLGHGLHRFVSFIWVNLLMILAVLIGTALMGIGLAIPSWLAFKFGGEVPFLWLFVAFLPFIPSIILPFYAYTRYHFAYNSLVVDGVSGWNALRASQKLVNRRFWAVFFRLMVILMLFTLSARFINYLIFLLVGSIAGDPRMFFSPIPDFTATTDLKIMTVTLISSAIYLIGLPLLTSADLIIWRDLKRTVK